MANQMQAESKRQAESKDATARWIEWLDTSPTVLWILIVLALLIIQGFGALSPLWGEDAYDTAKLNLCLLFLSLGLLGAYRIIRSDVSVSPNKAFVVVWGGALVHLAFIVWIHRMIMSSPNAVYLEDTLIPYILAPMVVTLLLGPSLGAFVTVLVAAVGMFFVAPSSVHQTVYLVTSIVAGMVTVLLAQGVRRRSQILKTGMLAGLSVLIVVPAVGGVPIEPLVGVKAALLPFIAAFGLSLLISILISGILPVLEAICKLTTPISWLELSDMNHPLLKQMQLQAPGTFHHSLLVGQLAEAAAEEIGANAQYCRVAAYYHDIGKLKYPQYFVENLADGEQSPHEGLTPHMSARIVIGHVADGLALAEEYKLNKKIADVIAQHHGTSLAYYFYRQALDLKEEMEEKVASGKAKVDDIPEVVESSFRYKGPIPQTREICIVSLADIAESATRSLHDPTLEQLHEMVDKVIKNRVIEGHLDAGNLTFGDLKKIRDSFVATLKNMRHMRIAYPDEKPKGHPVVTETVAQDAMPSANSSGVSEISLSHAMASSVRPTQPLSSIPLVTDTQDTVGTRKKESRIKSPTPKPLAVSQDDSAGGEKEV